MSSSLNIRNIGDARKTALESEAQRQGVSVADLVRVCIDQGLARAQAERAKAAWQQAARPGLEDEARHLERHGASLARHRRRPDLT